MIDPRIWPVLEEDFKPFQIYEIKELLADAKDLGGWDLDIVPQTLFDREYCSVCTTFYSKEVGELWINRAGKAGSIQKYAGNNPKPGYRVCIDFNVYNSNPFWPGW